MLSCWREYDLGDVLRDAYRDGTVLAGLSAGATCWFAEGLIDENAPRYDPIDGLGWVEGVAFTPHAHPLRRAAFREHVAAGADVGLAVEDGCAVELVDGAWRVRSSGNGEAAYRYWHENGQVRSRRLEDGDDIEGLGAPN